jgi:hypothetical protein
VFNKYLEGIKVILLIVILVIVSIVVHMLEPGFQDSKYMDSIRERIGNGESLLFSPAGFGKISVRVYKEPDCGEPVDEDN